MNTSVSKVPIETSIFAFGLQLRPGLASILPVSIAQQPPEDFPGGTLGNDIDELDPAGEPLVPGLLLLDAFADATFHGSIAFLQSYRARLDNKCFGQLTRSVVLDRDHSTVGHRGVVEETGF